jgi:tripartite-type tricarboxylate transporter receptor subunit TctC
MNSVGSGIMGDPGKSAYPLLLGALGAMLWLAPARSDPVEDFYKGKTVTIITSTGVGGPYDLTARAIAKYMPRYLPGHPAMIVKNMPGGGHVLATNFMFTQAAKDGTFVATVNNSIPLHQVLDGRGVRFDARRFHWLGSTGTSNLMTWAWHMSGFQSIDELMTRELIIGATGLGSGTFIYPNAMNVVLGTRFKIVMGYASAADIDLAMARGEVAARGGASLAGIEQEHPDWLRDKKLIALVQVGADREKAHPDVPLMHELAKTSEQRQILTLISSPALLGRPFFTTPEVPADRAAALRAAFDATMNDKGFLAEAKQLSLDLNPMGGDKVAGIVDATIDAPPDVVAKAKAAIAPADGSGGKQKD